MSEINQIDIGEIFKNHIKIEPQVWAIETLFNNTRRLEQTNYKPSYQRNYVWNDEKASYFIESILLGTEIPPLIYFNSGEVREVIDGRQRYETIYRFVRNEFKLKKAGLLIFKDLANKSFNDLKELRDIIWDTKLRIIEFSFHSKPDTEYDIEDKVKKEIFKRYNTGITPLTSTEIDKAFYIEDDLNGYIKKTLNEDKRLYDFIIELFSFDNNNIETVLKKIRQLLVQYKIPISYYANEKQEIINKFYELLTEEVNSEEDIKKIFNGFVTKINYLSEIKVQLDKYGTAPNISRLVLECFFWALSLLENENIPFSKVNNPTFKEKLIRYILDNILGYKTDRSSFNEQIFERYHTTAVFFEHELGLDLKNYIKNNEEFKKLNRGISKVKTNTDTLSKFESLRLNKPDAVSYSIEDISRLMTKQKFLVRPIYQRNEVINKNKSSAIIESIILGIKLPPIFIFKREDNVSEVIDGQQRLLSIIGFIGKDYLDENQNLVRSEKDKFALNLKNGILKDLDRKRFNNLDKKIQDKIIDFNLWIIEISQRSNPDFDPVDLYIRLNNKPYPIKENTFEMWNSYISRDIIETIKSIHKKNKDWFYFRKNNSRMEDENIYTSLAYLQYSVNTKAINKDQTYNDLDVYKVVDKISFRVKSKNEITKVLEDAELREDFIKACNDFEFIFIKKLKELVTDENDQSVVTLNKNLDYIFNILKRKRTQQSFYALWFFLYEIPFEVIVKEKNKIRDSLNGLYTQMTGIESKSAFENKVQSFRERYSLISAKIPQNIIDKIQTSLYAKLGDVTISILGLPSSNLIRSSNVNSKENYTYIKKARFQNYTLKEEETYPISLDDKPLFKDFFETKSKILIKRLNERTDRLTVAINDQRIIVNSDIFSFAITRSGFLPKFILAILTSRVTYFLYKKISNLIISDDIKNTTISELREIPIPILLIKDQIPFVNIVDYMLLSNNKNEHCLFFERLIDAMVYELFLSQEIKDAGCEFLKYLKDLPSLLPLNDEKNLLVNDNIITTVYKELSNPNHEISASLLKLLNVKEITLIEGII